MQEDMETNSVGMLETKKKAEWFYIMPFVYVIYIYLIPVVIGISVPERTVWEEMKTTCLNIMIMLVPFFGIGNIVTAVLHCKPRYKDKLFNAVILIKYALIPFFVLGGILLAFCFLLSFIPVPFMVFLGIPMTLIGSVAGWLVMAFGAPYAISYLCVTAKEGIRSKLMVVLHSILQFLFVWDVIDVMILVFRERRWRKLTIFIISVVTIAIIAAVIGFVVMIVKGTS